MLPDKNYPAIILHEPQLGENIGAAARVMLNFGLTDLRLVTPRDGWPNENAISNGAGAFDRIETTLFNTLDDAMANLKTVHATSARRRDLNIPVYTPSDITLSKHTGIVFGRERTGLENKHIARMNGIIELPVNPAFSSLNLAQAVGITVYALCHDTHDDIQNDAHDDSADNHTIKQFADRLEKTLEYNEFFRSPDLKPKMTDNIHALLSRLNPSDQEIRMLHGMISAMTKRRSQNT